MANSLALVAQRTIFQLPRQLTGFIAPCFSDSTVRNLYTKSSLGLDSFEHTKQRVKNQFANISEKFIDKMRAFTEDDAKGMVFTEDLKNMLHLAENDEHIELVVKMIKKFSKQNTGLRFGNYIYGPVAMRLFHYYNKPDVAFECFADPVIGNVFNQLISYQILLDLLYENGKYEEVLKAFEMIKERQIDGAKYPKNAVLLVYATLYKMNSKESLDYALKLYKELIEHGHNLMRRTVTFFVALAVNQGDPVSAMEALVGLQNQNYVTVRNLKVLALCDAGRLDEAVSVLKSVLSQDLPTTGTKQTFNVDVLQQVKEAFEKSNDAEARQEFNRIYGIIQSEGRVYDSTLEEMLCSEISSERATQDSRRNDRFQREYGDRRERGRYFQFNVRPGLAELQ